MDPEEIVRRVAELKLSSKTKNRSIKLFASEIETGKSRAAKMLIGKIFADRQHPREVLRDKLPVILQIRGLSDVELVGFNIFALHIDLDSDIERILTEGHWHIFNDLILIQKLDPMQSVAMMEFTDITVWVQLHNMPLARMNKDIVRRVGEQIGTVVEVESGEGGQCLGKFARVRITRLIHKPLVRGVPIQAEGTTESTMVLVLYEKLLDLFCFACGKIEHHLKNCDTDANAKAALSYGSWLRAGRGSDYRRPGTFNDTRFNPRARPNGPRPPPKSTQEEMRAITTNTQNVQKEIVMDNVMPIREGLMTIENTAIEEDSPSMGGS